MTAIIRIKRNCTDDPLDAVVINCKKRKLDENAAQDEDIATVLNFAGTVNSTDDVIKHIKKLNKSEVEEQYKKHNMVDIIDKLRMEKEVTSKNSRYKVVNSHRFPNTNDTESNVNCTIVDVESEELKNAEHSNNFVYDLYYTNSDDFGEPDLNELISVYPLSEGLVYGSYRDNGYNYPDSDYSEDSNAENHWRNDYPDESDCESHDESITENDMMRNMVKVDLGDDEDLSSDNYSAEEEDYYCDESCTP
ncbi:hypothetical protein PPYR_01264 [Photinus pyralis]|uniref:Probable RNA polymerase II nuclear localization protein SLC7A6OS n=1 Tax=Photinus pyralis TaxID=7054 RepID=A0A1Y1K3Z4_PHOPY|nr:probable RNA polymerase II nuclear localization protein SLC7A6OS [Photinus pyralis]KAB0804294.1 hypothetical protein PPYR_01264 [Photinus pyralis]